MKIPQKFLVAALAIGSAQLLSAQFATDFTAGQGYADGTLNGNAAWRVPNPVVWTVADAGGAGFVDIRPTAGFQRLFYEGVGWTLTSNAYSSSNVFVLDYTADTAGTHLTPPANVLMARFEFVIPPNSEPSASALRQMASGPGVYSLFLFGGMNTPAPQVFGQSIEAEMLGLAHDGTVWTDPVSDRLEIIHTLVYNQDPGEWAHLTTLTNLTTGVVLQTLFQTYVEDDGSFLAASNAYLINTGRLIDLPNMLFRVDSVSVTTDAVYVPPMMWGGYNVDEDTMTVDTGAWLGELNVANAPWIWSSELQAYLYLPEENLSATGAWAFLVGPGTPVNAPEAGAVVWAGFSTAFDGTLVDTGEFLGWLQIANAPWVYSYTFARFLYLPETTITPTGAWSFIPG